MKLFPKQQIAVYYLKDKVTSEIVYGGAAGPGKSLLGCAWLAECCLKYPKSRWVMGRSKLKRLEETTLRTWTDFLADTGLAPFFKHNQQKNVITCYNGSEIILKDLFLYPQDPEFDSLGSLEICGGFIDECVQVNVKAWQVLKSRMRYRLDKYCEYCGCTHKKKIIERDPVTARPVRWLCSKGHEAQGLTPKLLGTCNPAKNWVYKNFFKPHRDGNLPKGKAFIAALPTDNPYLPKSYIEALLSLDDNSRQRLYYGNWEYDDDPTVLIDHDAIGDYFDPGHVTKGTDRYMTIDVARLGKDKTIFRIWYGWLCKERHEIATSKLDEVVAKAKQLRGKHAIPLTNIVADEDGVGGGVVDFLKCKGFVNNSSALGGENYRNLKAQCYCKMAAKIMAREAGEICNDAQIKDLVSGEMEQVRLKTLDPDGKIDVVSKDDIKARIGRSPDDWDSIAMRYYFALSKPKTQTRIRV